MESFRKRDEALNNDSFYNSCESPQVSVARERPSYVIEEEEKEPADN